MRRVRERGFKVPEPPHAELHGGDVYSPRSMSYAARVPTRIRGSIWAHRRR
jgi:hypothetical protein